MSEPRLAQITVALLWLTRLPLGRFLPAKPPVLSAALWAFPLAGMVVGLAGASALILADTLNATPLIAALVAVSVQVWLTSGLHEDGLADFADGMGGGTREKRLDIMRDSRIGSYGAVTLGLATAMRVAAISALLIHAAAIWLIAAAALSRAAIVMVLRALPPARSDGLGRGAGRASLSAALIALGIGVGACVIATLLTPVGFWGMCALILATGAATILLGNRARCALGGQTGDVLGAAQQLAEITALVVLAALLS